MSRIHTNASLILRWLLIIVPTPATVGSVVALFLWLLDLASVTRTGQPWLLYLLPFAGLNVVSSHRAAGKNSQAGNEPILEKIHERGAGVHGRTGPLVLVGRVVSELFGGSAGRDGTAVQTSGSLIEQLCTWPRLNEGGCRLMPTAGIAVGFGACFSTLLAGAIFAQEEVAVGRIEVD